MIGDDTIVKALGIANGLDPLPNILLSLRDLSSSKLKVSINLVEDGLSQTIDFIKSNFYIYGSDYVPYEGQILVLYNALLWSKSLNAVQIASLKKWFWTTGLNESLRGKPDNFVARTVKSVIPAMLEPSAYFGRRLQITSYEFRTRRFIRGKALSATVATMFAKSNARSLVNGEIISPENYMSSWNTKTFSPIISADTLRFMSIDDIILGRMVSNIFVSSPSDRAFFNGVDLTSYLTENLERAGYEEILASQFISKDAVECLKSYDIDGFINARAESLYKASANIINELDDQMPPFDEW